MAQLELDIMFSVAAPGAAARRFARSENTEGGETFAATKPRQPKNWGLPSDEIQFRLLNIIKHAATEQEQMAAKAELIEKFRPYEETLARQIWRRNCRREGSAGPKEVISEGMVGLVESIEKWDPKFGKPLSNLASQNITFRCQKACRTLNQAGRAFEVPTEISRAVLEVRNAIMEKGYHEGRQLCFSSKKRRSTQQTILLAAQSASQNAVSLNAPNPCLDGGEEILNNLHDTRQNPNHEITEVLELCRQALLTFTDKEKLVFYCAYPKLLLTIDDIPKKPNGKNIDIEEIASLKDNPNAFLGLLYDVTAERIRQIRKEVHEKLLNFLREHGIDNTCLALFGH